VIASAAVNIYFAGAIRGGRDDRVLYLEIIELLGAYGRVLTEHVGDYLLTDEGEDSDDAWIHERDSAWLHEADCLVAEVTTPSLGVGYEIGKMTEWRRPVLCLFRPNKGRRLSALIAGNPLVEVREYDNASALKQICEEFFGRLA